MRYRELIDPQLWSAARRVPYNRAVIWCANIFLPAALTLTRAPQGIRAGRLAVPGYGGRVFKTQVFEPETPGPGTLPALIYLHGGAFTYTASPYHKRLACLYALGANCRVYFPDYSLAPRYPYPAAYEDALALYRYVTERDGGIAGAAGDSAGAALAAALCNSCEREGLRAPCLQMLVYPLTDMTMGSASMKKYPDTPLWNSKSNRRALRYYLGGREGAGIPEASPLHMALPGRIPDTYIETAEYDCLHDEGVLYAKRLLGAGARVELNETKGTIHGYDCAMRSKIAQSSIEKRIGFLNKLFNISRSD